MLFRSMYIGFIFATLLFTAPQSGLAQSDVTTCPVIVEQALSQVSQNCAGLDRNSVCYGFPRVAATFSQTVPADYFSDPADRVNLFTVRTLQTSPFDLNLGEWGIALLKAQANVPDTLPGQAVTFVLLGETEVENAVEPAAAQGGTPVTAIVQTNTEILNVPGGQTIAAIAAGTVLDAAEQSADGLWLHVRTPTLDGWLPQEAVTRNPRLASLPVAGQPRLSPMQAFYLHSVPGELACSQAPSVLAIQSPQNITVDLVANGANIRLGSLILLRILPPGDRLQLTVIEGQAILDAGTPNEVEVPAGFTTTRCLDEAQDLGIDGESNDRSVGADCSWQPPMPVTPEEQEENLLILGIFDRLGLNQQQVSCPTGTTLTHTVQRGETLFRIATRYNSSVAVIAAANNITNPQQIFAGQTLTIPCGVDTGVPSFPPTTVPVPTGAPVSTVDCSGFVATSPLDGLPYGNGTFYWNPASGASGYRLNIYNEDEQQGALVASITVAGNITSVTTDLTINTIGYGFRFSWEVQALAANGTPACTTARAVVPRQPPPTDVPPVVETPEETPPPVRGNNN